MTEGAKTSEFILAIVGGIVAVANGVTSPNVSVQVTAIICTTAIVCAFVWSRTRVKQITKE